MTLMAAVHAHCVRRGGLHLPEKHMRVDDRWARHALCRDFCFACLMLLFGSLLGLHLKVAVHAYCGGR